MPEAQLLIQATILGLLVGGIYAVMSSGLTLIFGVMRVINIAHGALIVFSAYLTYWLFTNYQVDPFLSMILTVPLLFVAGWLLQRLILSRFTENIGPMSVLSTFGLAIALEGLMGFWWSTIFRSVKVSYPWRSFVIGGYYFPFIRLLAFAAALLILGLLFLLLTRTKLGRAIRATTQDRRAAQLVGVDVERVAAITFGIGIALAAAGGAFMAILFAFFPATHYLWISKVLAIVVVGGLGSLPGALVGSLILGTLESIATVVVDLSWAPIVFYIFLFGTLLIKPEGLFGQRGREGI
ncbi:MAG: branched-chain amino acid ABC transporter permease [Anaerolineae bacterium]